MHFSVQRDDIGIGGDMSEFLNYLITSLKLGDVKLRLEGHSGKEGNLFC